METLNAENNNINDSIYEDETIAELEKQLLRTEWVEEARQIPLDAVNGEEQAVLIKCINKENLTNQELILLRQTLAAYRDAIEKQDPAGTVESVTNNIKLVEDEKAFLKLLEDERKNNIITMYYPLNNGLEAKLVLDIYPVTDSQAVLDITENLGLFKDLTDDELLIYNKSQTGENLSREELILLEDINKKINRLTQKNQIEIIKEFLAKQTKFHGKNSSYEEMYKVYNAMQIGYLALLFQQVQQKAGLGDIETEKVFRKSD